jgi:hypothetical protein
MAAVGANFSPSLVRVSFNLAAALALWPTMVNDGWSLEFEQ